MLICNEKLPNLVIDSQYFCVTQILREINFEDSRSEKSAMLTHLEALKLDFYEFIHFLEAEIKQLNKIHCH